MQWRRVVCKNINWLNFCRFWHCHHLCVFSGWYPFVEFCVNVGNYGGKSVIINWLNFCRIWHCNQICVFQSDTLLLSFTLMLANMVGNRLNCTIWYKNLRTMFDDVFLRLSHFAGVQPSRRPHRHWGWHTDTHGGQLSFGCTSTQGWGLCHRHTDIQVPKNTHRDIYIYTH